MSVNTRDGTAQYDVAFALVWVEDDSPALNKNEAYAFASCTSCAAISVAFQVVLVSGDNHVAVPQNISAAVNYNCVNCLTYALATQLFVTLDGPLKDGSVRALNALWQEIADFGRHLTQVPLSEVRDRLSAYEQKILGIIEQDQGPLGQTPAATPTTGPTEGTTGAPSDGPTDAGTPSPAATPSNGSDPTPAGTDRVLDRRARGPLTDDRPERCRLPGGLRDPLNRRYRRSVDARPTVSPCCVRACSTLDISSGSSRTMTRYFGRGDGRCRSRSGRVPSCSATRWRR